MSSARRVRVHSKLRHTIIAGAVALVSAVGFIAAAGPVQAAGPWYVATNGVNNATCGTSGAPCLTVTFLIAQARFIDGDTINVAAGTYTDRPVFGSKTANLVGAGTATTIFSGSNTSFAIGVAVTNAKTFKLTNATLTAGKTALGGGLAFTSGQVVLSGVNITNSTSTNVGGGAAVPGGGSLTMTNGTISGNTATNGGGGIYNPASATITLNGTTVSGNTGALGGGIYAAANSTTNLTNGAISNNSGPSAAGGLYGLGTLNVNGTTFNANTSPLGAGMAVAGAPTLTGATISNNVSTNQGGGIYFNTGTLTISGGAAITGNKAPSGAGIYQNAGTTNATGSSISTNISSGSGGGFYEVAGAFNTTNTTIDGNTATTLAGAGAVAGGTASFTGGSISNSSALNAGALYNGGATTIDGTTVSGNAANGGATTNGGNGGAVYNAAALTVKNATLSGNKAVLNTNATPGISGYGGSIFSANLAANAPGVDFTNTTIDGGNVSGGNAYIGGAIAVYQNTVSGGTTSKITGNGLTLSNNVAQAAGGLFSYGNVTLNGSTVSGNKATNTSGGGLGGGLYDAAVSGTTPALILDNTTVTGNDAVAGGGGAIIGAGVTTTIRNGSKINANTSATGAGLYNGSALTVADSQVNGNTASVNGGGVYTLGATTLTSTKIDNNTAAFLGGGLIAGAQATVTGGEFDSNNAYGAGGALVSDSVVASFTGTTFDNNTSTGANFGGGAILSGGQVTIKDTTFTANTADGTSGSGGAIYSGSTNDNVTTSLKIDSSLFSGNDAAAAAAIVAGSNGSNSTNKTSINNSTITGNASTTAVGALEFFQPASITGSTITDNTATGSTNYGGLYAAVGTVSLSGSVLSGNSGKQCAAAPTDGGYNLISPTDATCALSAAKHDVFAAPQLGALANNGGPTKSLLPGPASPALDRIPAGTATGVTDAISGNAVTLCGSGAVDQRGTSRPQGAKCDVGAVEANQITPTVSGPGAFTYSVGIAGAAQVYTSTGSPQPTLSATGLPSGVTFTDNGDGTGKITGTPAANSGGTYTVTVKATNEAGTGTETVTVDVNQASALAGPAAATYTVGTAGGPTTFTTTGHPTATLSSMGLLPGGVGFTDNGDGTGAYAGTPAGGTGGVYNLTVKAANGTPPDATAPFALTVDEAPGLTGPGAATFKVGTASSSTPDFAGSGFPVPTLTVTGLPTGLALVGTGSGTAKISGTAANGTGGVYPGVQVKADNGVGSSATKAVNVTVNEAPELVGPTEARFVTGSSNAIGFSSDGYPVASVAESGALPSGLTFHDNGNGSATISGTAATGAVGTYAITITASNGQSPDAVLHLTLEVVPPLSISTSTLPNAAYHSAYSAQLMSTGGQPGYSYAVTVGQLPAGLSMNAFGLITGSPTVSTGTYIFTVKATDSAHPAQTDTKILKITVTKGVTRVTPTAILLGFLPNGDVTVNAGLVEADLKGGFPEQPIAAATITFKSGTTTVCSGKTDADGHAQCSQSVLNAILTPLKGDLTATYSGDLNWLGSTGSATLIQKTNQP